jgi:hypothetical protein
MAILQASGPSSIVVLRGVFVGTAAVLAPLALWGAASRIATLFLFAACAGALALECRRAIRARAPLPSARGGSDPLARLVDPRRFEALVDAELRRVARSGSPCTVIVLVPRSVPLDRATARATLAWASVGACRRGDVVSCVDPGSLRFAVLLRDAPASLARFIAARTERALDAVASSPGFAAVSVGVGMAEAGTYSRATAASILEAAASSVRNRSSRPPVLRRAGGARAV